MVPSPAEQSAALHQLAAQVVAHMEGWVLREDDRHEHWAPIEHEITGARLVFVQWGNRHRLTIRVDWPRHPSGTHGDAYSWGVLRFDERAPDSITVNPRREPRLLARDILRRLGTWVLTAWVTVAKRLNAELIQADGADALLMELLGGTGHRNSYGYRITYEGYTSFPGSEHHCRVKVLDSENLTVDLDFHYLTPTQARTIMGALRRST